MDQRAAPVGLITMDHMVSGYVLALDQGTTSSRAVLFRRNGTVGATAQAEVPQIFPAPGVVEHDPEAIWQSQLNVARQVMAENHVSPAEIAAIGITNQRETTIVWEKATGRPIHNAIVWQSRVTADMCDALKLAGHEELVRDRTGLPIDPYFSATKIGHILRVVPGAPDRAAAGELLFGTVDTFLIWRLTEGRVHVSDYSNCSRTLLFDIRTLDWDDDLLGIMGIPRAMLPEPRPSSEVYGETRLLGGTLPISGCAGDQQAATFGQACFEPGDVKQTYGTGAFMLMNTGLTPVRSDNRLLTTIAWGYNDTVTYALEGSVFVAGAAVQWIRDGLRAIARSSDIEQLAAAVPDSGGVYLVPAFVGLGAPHWDPYARGAIFGLTRGSTTAHIARAAIDSIAYQTADILEAMEADAGDRVSALKVDGGAAVNDALMQFQADILGTPVVRPEVTQTTALGAAYLAGLAVGFWTDTDDIARNWALDRRFEPAMSAATRDKLLSGWRNAVRRTLESVAD